MKRWQAAAIAAILMVISFGATIVLAGCFDEGGWSGQAGTCFHHDAVYESSGIGQNAEGHYASGNTYTWPTEVDGYYFWANNNLPSGWSYWFAHASTELIASGEGVYNSSRTKTSSDNIPGYYNLWDVLGEIGGGLQSQNRGVTQHLVVYQIDDCGDVVNQALMRFTLQKPGDADKNGVVDEDDQAILAANWQQAGDWEDGDFSGDGYITLQDLQIMATYWD